MTTQKENAKVSEQKGENKKNPAKAPVSTIHQKQNESTHSQNDSHKTINEKESINDPSRLDRTAEPEKKNDPTRITPGKNEPHTSEPTAKVQK